MNKIIYLDNNSTTQVDQRVISEMLPCFSEYYGNPASSHKFGSEAKKSIDRSRQLVAEMLNALSEEVIFTSGSTEAINLALKGLAKYNPKKTHIITCSTEHPATLDTCRDLEESGYEVTYLPVDRQGIINIDELESSLSSKTLVVSVMLANNETGVLQPLKSISKLCKRHGVLLLSDATQGVGKLKVDVDELGVDLLALSAHKFYGPKGIGALYIRKGTKITPLIYGGGHELGLRSGTLNVPGIVGLGKASELVLNELAGDEKRISGLRDKLEEGLLKIIGVRLNGDKQKRLSNTTNLVIEGVDADVLISQLGDTIISNGSACSSQVIEASHVLKSMGLSNEEAFSSIRISLGRFTTEQDISTAITDLRNTINRLRN